MGVHHRRVLKMTYHIAVDALACQSSQVLLAFIWICFMTREYIGSAAFLDTFLRIDSSGFLHNSVGIPCVSVSGI